jgi:hypothetical protein
LLFYVFHYKICFLPWPEIYPGPWHSDHGSLDKPLLCSYCTPHPLKFNCTLLVLRTSVSCFLRIWRIVSQRNIMSTFQGLQNKYDITDRNTTTFRQRFHENKLSRLSIHASTGASESWKLNVFILGRS